MCMTEPFPCTVVMAFEKMFRTIWYNSVANKLICLKRTKPNHAKQVLPVKHVVVKTLQNVIFVIGFIRLVCCRH